jgi:hypothetical protein
VSVLVIPARQSRPWVQIGEMVGQQKLAVTAAVYSHVLMDEAEVDHETLLARPSVLPS